MQIGELSERTGVSPQLLRVWERRYGLLRPERSPGGFRLYSDADERRVNAMNERLAAGFPAAAAARLVIEASENSEEVGGGGAFAAVVRRDVRSALRRPAEAATPVVFFVVVAAVFPLGTGASPAALAAVPVSCSGSTAGSGRWCERPVPCRCAARRPAFRGSRRSSSVARCSAAPTPSSSRSRRRSQSRPRSTSRRSDRGSRP